jgi:hypothetical protein
VPRPRPILTGPDRPGVLSLTEAQLRLRVSRAGLYRIAVRWSPYWQTSAGCLSEGKDEMLRLRTGAARLVVLTFAIDTTNVLDQLAGTTPVCRAAATSRG